MAEFTRRTLLKGVYAGSSGLVLAPLLQTLKAQAAGTYTPPKRVIFLLFDNGFHERGAQPVDLPLETVTKVKRTPLDGLKLPLDIEPLKPFQDRMTIVQGLRGHHISIDHGGGFRSLSGLPSADKRRSVVGESIDAAIAREVSGVFPMLALGIAANGKGEVGAPTALASSAWGPSKPIASQLRPELVYESLFGSVGAKANDFATRRNMLDFMADDVKRLRLQIAGPEKEALDHHLEALESLFQRQDELAQMQDQGRLGEHAPKLPEKPVVKMTEISSLQCELAGAALVAGLTNVVTISSGLCTLGTAYTGISNHGTHALGHNEIDPSLGKSGREVLGLYRRHLAGEAAKLLARLAATHEGGGTMLDNTLLVFMSDSANRQHTHGENWPVVLVGNLGGRLQSGQVISYPLQVKTDEDDARTAYGRPAFGDPTNPLINSLYCTLLHAVGAPRDTFNRAPGLKESPETIWPAQGDSVIAIVTEAAGKTKIVESHSLENPMKKQVLTLLFAITIAALASHADACQSAIIGKESTADGRVISWWAFQWGWGHRLYVPRTDDPVNQEAPLGPLRFTCDNNNLGRLLGKTGNGVNENGLFVSCNINNGMNDGRKSLAYFGARAFMSRCSTVAELERLLDEQTKFVASGGKEGVKHWNVNMSYRYIIGVGDAAATPGFSK